MNCVVSELSLRRFGLPLPSQFRDRVCDRVRVYVHVRVRVRVRGRVNVRVRVRGHARVGVGMVSYVVLIASTAKYLGQTNLSLSRC